MTVLDLVFKCRKCGHILYVGLDKTEWLDEPEECPACGEEGYENWLYLYRGNLK